ncbi:Uncharacterised protein [Eubacterium ramulus]|uniref:Uncharacterized protein n=1 Tax=Eubacterium ramulus TaxID=39490 RepID=A0A173V5U4_EUBRA|nr:Uncharacterised protein [Eubacterium ramulus]
MRILVLVPSTGNLYIYMEEAIDDCEEVSSRPLHGESIYLLTMFNTMRAVKQCSRPLHGESIYLQKLLGDDMKDMIVLVPSTGNLYIYYLQERADYLSELFSSPPRGIYISTNIVHGQLCSILFSSPPRGIYISTNTCIFVHALVISSRPLHGESIYLPN